MTTAQTNASAVADWRGILVNYGLCETSAIQRGEDEAAPIHGEHKIDLSRFVELLEKVNAVSRKAGLSWNAGLAGDYGARGRVGRAVLGAKTLGAGLKRLTDYFPLLQDATFLRLDVEGSWASLSYKILDPDIWPRHEDAMYSLGLYAALVRSAAPGIWDQMEITVEAENHQVKSDLSNVVRTSVIYGGAANVLRFPVSALSETLGLAPPASASLLGNLSRDVVMKKRSRSFRERAREQIYIELNEGFAGQERIARELGVCSRTLRRKLAKEHCSFQSLLDECRMRFAAHEFRNNSETTLSEMALRLGYSEHSTFSRAFGRWAGVAPQEYRRAMMVN